MDTSVNKNISFLEDLKRDVEVKYFLRRYRKVLDGQIPWEEKALTVAQSTITAVSLSWRRLIKRTLDIAGSLFALVLSAPLVALTGLIIKLDSPGPAIFKQKRVGMRGKIFTMYKFRTMREDAEVLTGAVWATEDDPRTTRLGKFLRVTHLDELPQLVNVLQGEMSFVGPRPERPYFVNEFRRIIPHYDRRLCVKPGITGLAQVKRGYDRTLADVKKKLKYDILYVEKMCPFVDVRILAMTIGEVLLGTGR